MKRIVLGFLVLAAVFPTGGRWAVAEDLEAGSHVDIQNFAFSPKTLTVPVGTTVTWINHDDESHTVTSSDTLFRSPGLDAGESFSYRFTAPGTYVYFCALHPHMTATIIVP